MHTKHILNTLGIHMAYTGNTHGMSETWYAHGIHSMIHIAYSCACHTHTLHAWNAHGLHMVCTLSTPGLHMASHGIHRLLRMLASHASHLICSIYLPAYPKDPFPPCWSFPFPFPFGHVHVERIVAGSSFVGHDLRKWRRWRLPRPC